MGADGAATDLCHAMHAAASIIAPMLKALLASLRPLQWSKNLFVVAPLAFSKTLTEPSSVAPALIGFVAFCLAASAVYLFKADIRADRIAVSAAEIAVVFGAFGFVTGMLWGRKAWGV